MVMSVVRRADAIVADAARSEVGGSDVPGVRAVVHGNCRRSFGFARFTLLVCPALLGTCLFALADDLAPIGRSLRQ
jgi:hypothetical protein